MMMGIQGQRHARLCCDVGVPADEFADCFKIIREIIPVTEDVPEAIRISEDCDEE